MTPNSYYYNNELILFLLYVFGNSISFPLLLSNLNVYYSNSFLCYLRYYYKK